MKNFRARSRVWLNSYVQHKKMVGENTHQVQLGENNENVCFFKNKFRNCSALSIKIALAFDVVRDLEGCQDTARCRRTYPRRTAATITNAAGYTPLAPDDLVKSLAME